MWARRIDAGTTSIAEAYKQWERIWLGEQEIRRFLAYTGLSAQPYSLTVEDFLRFPFRRGMTAKSLVRKLRRLGISWSANRDVMRRAILLAIGYKQLDISQLEHKLVFDRGK